MGHLGFIFPLSSTGWGIPYISVLQLNIIANLYSFLVSFDCFISKSVHTLSLCDFF